MTEHRDDFDQALDALLRLPRFTPSSDFAERVMARVVAAPLPAAIPVSIPPRPIWDPSRGRVVSPVAEAPRRQAIRWLPGSRPIRYAAAAMAGTASLTITALTVAALTRLDLVALTGTMAIDRIGTGFAIWGTQLATGVFGDTAFGYLQATGSPQGALTVAGFAVGAYAAMAGLRAAAAATPTRI